MNTKNTTAHRNLLAGLALFFAAGGMVARAQEFAPRIGFVYPAGGKQGTTIEVTVGGQHLVGPAGAIVSGSGVRAVVVVS